MHIGNVHFYHRHTDCTDCVGNGYRRVGVGSGVDDDAVAALKAVGVKCVDDVAFVVALVVVDCHVAVAAAYVGEHFVERTVAVDARHAASE